MATSSRAESAMTRMRLKSASTARTSPNPPAKASTMASKTRDHNVRSATISTEPACSSKWNRMGRKPQSR
ncbi:hypothetical protein D3C87_1773530 [compost metagenome]